MDITTDAYVNDNRRNDIPQVRTVLINIKYTKDLYQRAVTTADRMFSDCQDTQLNQAECVARLLRGSYPQFWAEETGEEAEPAVLRLPTTSAQTPATLGHSASSGTASTGFTGTGNAATSIPRLRPETGSYAPFSPQTHQP